MKIYRITQNIDWNDPNRKPTQRSNPSLTDLGIVASPDYPYLNDLDLSIGQIMSIKEENKRVVDNIRIDKPFPYEKGYEVIEIDGTLNGESIKYTTIQKYY